MPARSYRVTIQNRTSWPLTLKEAHLCHGDWTPGGWEPSQSIHSNDAKGLQSESAGVFTGTEGWVKYTLGDPRGDEQVYVHWQIPYEGIPVITGYDKSSAQVSLTDVMPHCDAESGGGNSFGGPPLYDVKLVFASQGPADPTLEEVLATYSNPVATLVGVLSGFVIHIYVTLDVREIGSVRQALPRSYDASLGLRRLTKIANTQSVRELLGL